MGMSFHQLTEGEPNQISALMHEEAHPGRIAAHPGRSPEVSAHIEEKLREDYSPEQISGGMSASGSAGRNQLSS
ncbi:MAG: hypothetical protein J7M24_06090 [Candidatus Latescibacteria bacterium]|nr:hypothetical protein [Candidatus Latescibacterota bacterium]